MGNPTISKKNPYKVVIEKGKTYFWCACGMSQNQPFCDGAHKKDRKFKPVKYFSEKTKEVFFCGCKMTKNPPFCDGSHSSS